MVQVLIRRGLNFDELLRHYDEEGNGVIDKDQFIKACLSLGLPFGVRSLSLVYNRFSVSSTHIDYEALLQEIYHGAAAGGNRNMRTVSDDSLENGDSGGISTILIELRRMLRESAEAFHKSFDDIYRMFSRWDVGGTGTVTATQFLRVLTHLHIVFSEQDQDLMVELFDSSGEGRVDFDSLLTFCFHHDSDFTLDSAQSPFAHKSYSYFGDDNTTSNSALSVGSVDNADASVEKLDGPSSSPDMRQVKSSQPENHLRVAVDISSATSKPGAIMSPPEKNTARSNSSGFQGGRPRPHTANGDKRAAAGDGGSTAGSLRGGATDAEHMTHRHNSNGQDGNSNGSQNVNNTPGNGRIESPTSRARRMVRPMTAAPRVPLTVSVPRQPRGSNLDADISIVDEFVVDVLSDDDVLDGDEDAMDLRSYEAATDRSEAARGREPEHVEHVDDYNDRMKEERAIRQFKSAAAAVVGPVVLDLNRNTDDRKGSNQGGDRAQNQQGRHASREEQNADNQQHYQEQEVVMRATPPSPQHREDSAGVHHRNAPSKGSEQENTMYMQQRNLPPTHGAEPAVALKILRRDIIHRHQKSGKTLYDIFRTFDVQGNRYFGANDLQRTMMELALPIDSGQAHEMIKLLGLDGEERVCFAEFAVFITDPDFPVLADRVQKLVSENYEKQGREYQLKLYNITMHGPTNAHNNYSATNIVSSGNNGVSAITGFIQKAAFEAALAELGLVASGNSKLDSRGSVPLLNSVEVSRLCVRFDTHGRDLCSVAKFLRMVQNCHYWRSAEQNVVVMEEAAEEAQTAREELAHYPSGMMTIGPPPGYILNEELIDMAEYLGVRVLSEPYLLQIVDNAVRAPVPEGWSLHTDKKGRNFFFHQRSGRSQWDHPADAEFRRMRDEARVAYNTRKQNTGLDEAGGYFDGVAGPGEQTRRNRPVSAKGTLAHTPAAAPAHYMQAQQTVDGGRNTSYTQQHTAQYDSNGFSTPYVEHGRSAGYYDNPRQDSPVRMRQTPQPDVTAIGDAVVQAMQNMDPKDLLQILNKNGDLMSAMGVSKSRGDEIEYTPNRNSISNEPTLTRNNSAPVHSSGAAILLVPPAATSSSSKKAPLSGSKKERSVTTPSQKKTHPSYRHNGSGMFDPMRGDRQRIQHKRTHNWTAPSAVDRALNIGSTSHSAQKRSDDAEYTDDNADVKATSPYRREDETPYTQSVPGSHPKGSKTSQTIPPLNRPKSGSSIRRKVAPTDMSTDEFRASERSKTSNRPKSGVPNNKNAPSHGPYASAERAGADIYGDKLLSRLDTLVARHHSPSGGKHG